MPVERWIKPWNDATANRRVYTEEELDQRRVNCPCCGLRAEATTTFGSLISDFECGHCGAIWRGDRRGRVLRFLHLDLCAA